MTGPADDALRHRYAAALWMLAWVLNGRTPQAKAAQLETAAGEARAAFPGGAVDTALADLETAATAIHREDPFGRTVSSCTPAARERRQGQRVSAREAVLAELGLGS